MSTAGLLRKLPILSISLALVAGVLTVPAQAERSDGTGAVNDSSTSANTNTGGNGGSVTAPEPNNFPNAGSSAGGTFESNYNINTSAGSGNTNSMNTYWSLGETPRLIIEQREAAEAQRKRYEKAFVAPPKVTWTQFKGRRNGSLQANSCLVRKQQGVWEVISDPIMEKYPDPDSAAAQSYKRRVLGLPPLPGAGGGGASIIPQVKRQAPTQAPPQPGNASGSALKG